MIPTVELNNGKLIPQLGFGVFRVSNDDATKAVLAALDAGIRLIDTASYYGNEQGVGQAIRSSGISRDDIYVTTKLWHTDLGYDSTLRAFERSMNLLGLDYLDLYLIHWPVPSKDLYMPTWKAFQKLQSDEQIRTIGVSNFPQPQLQKIINETQTTPAVNQIELHPQLAQKELRKFHRHHGIVTQAWSPLGHGKILDEPTIQQIAQQHGKTPAQILLRWSIDLGNCPLFKSIRPERIRENLNIFDFTLTEQDHACIDALNTGQRTGPDPMHYGA